jgi:hypothetical protein
MYKDTFSVEGMVMLRIRYGSVSCCGVSGCLCGDV